MSLFLKEVTGSTPPADEAFQLSVLGRFYGDFILGTNRLIHNLRKTEKEDLPPTDLVVAVQSLERIFADRHRLILELETGKSMDILMEVLKKGQDRSSFGLRVDGRRNLVQVLTTFLERIRESQGIPKSNDFQQRRYIFEQRPDLTGTAGGAESITLIPAGELTPQLNLIVKDHGRQIYTLTFEIQDSVEKVIQKNIDAEMEADRQELLREYAAEVSLENFNELFWDNIDDCEANTRDFEKDFRTTYVRVFPYKFNESLWLGLADYPELLELIERKMPGEWEKRTASAGRGNMMVLDHVESGLRLRFAIREQKLIMELGISKEFFNTKTEELKNRLRGVLPVLKQGILPEVEGGVQAAIDALRLKVETYLQAEDPNWEWKPSENWVANYLEDFLKDLIAEIYFEQD